MTMRGAALLLLLCLSGCTRTPPSSERVLEFWHSMSGEKGKLLRAIVDDFNALPSNAGQLRVRMQFVGTYEEGLNKLRTALLAKRGPHIAQITDIGTQVVIDTEATRPLADFTDGDPEFPSAELLPPIRRYYEVRGRLASLPFATSNPILYYNAELLAKAGIAAPPATFAELEATAAKLTDRAQHRTGVTWPLHSWFLEQFIARQGAPFVNHGNGRESRATELLVLSPEAQGFVGMWARMVRAGTFSNVGRGWDPAVQNFLAGRSAMLITSTSDVFEITRKADFQVRTAPLPRKDAASRVGGTIVGGNSLWLLEREDPAEEKASYRFLKYMASKPVQKRWHTRTGYFPIRRDVIRELTAEGFYEKNPNALTAIRQLEASPDGAPTRGALLGVFPEAREAVDSGIERILTVGEPVATSLTRAKREAEAAMTRYNRGRAAAGKF